MFSYISSIFYPSLETQQKPLLVDLLGNENVSHVKALPTTSKLNRFQIYQGEHTKEIFKELNPSTIWLQDQSKCVANQELLDRIKKSGGKEKIDISLIWSQSPGKIYIAYPQNKETFILERFLIGTKTFVAQEITKNELKDHLVRHLKTKKEISQDPIFDEKFNVLQEKQEQLKKIEDIIAKHKTTIQGIKAVKKRKRIYAQIQRMTELLNDHQQKLADFTKDIDQKRVALFSALKKIEQDKQLFYAAFDQMD